MYKRSFTVSCDVRIHHLPAQDTVPLYTGVDP
jgi:hypothetical protein